MQKQLEELFSNLKPNIKTGQVLWTKALGNTDQDGSLGKGTDDYNRWKKDP